MVFGIGIRYTVTPRGWYVTHDERMDNADRQRYVGYRTDQTDIRSDDHAISDDRLRIRLRIRYRITDGYSTAAQLSTATAANTSSSVGPVQHPVGPARLRGYGSVRRTVKRYGLRYRAVRYRFGYR